MGPFGNDAAQTPEDAARQEGSRAIDNAILRMARAAGAEIRERPIWPGSAITGQYADPAKGIRFALMLRDSATQAIREHIKRGRQEGLTWHQVGEALNLAAVAEERGAPLGEVAFDYAADVEHARPWSTPSFPWTCPACGALVSDRGPFESHPEDNEPGHAEGCERMARLVAEHDARWADE